MSGARLRSVGCGPAPRVVHPADSHLSSLVEGRDLAAARLTWAGGTDSSGSYHTASFGNHTVSFPFGTAGSTSAGPGRGRPATRPRGWPLPGTEPFTAIGTKNAASTSKNRAVDAFLVKVS
jgi:hypothetical protein